MRVGANGGDVAGVVVASYVPSIELFAFFAFRSLLRVGHTRSRSWSDVLIIFASTSRCNDCDVCCIVRYCMTYTTHADRYIGHVCHDIVCHVCSLRSLIFDSQYLKACTDALHENRGRGPQRTVKGIPGQRIRINKLVHDRYCSRYLGLSQCTAFESRGA